MSARANTPTNRPEYVSFWNLGRPLYEVGQRLTLSGFGWVGPGTVTRIVGSKVEVRLDG